jgi:hypothetical protein
MTIRSQIAGPCPRTKKERTFRQNTVNIQRVEVLEVPTSFQHRAPRRERRAAEGAAEERLVEHCIG